MYRKAVVLPLLVMALLAMSVTGTEEQEQRKQRRISRLRNRPGLYQIEGGATSNTPRRPRGLVNAGSSSGLYNSRPVHRAESSEPRNLKSSKSSKSEKSRPIEKRAKSTKAEKTRQAPPSVDDMSMSMDFFQMDMSMSMELRQMELSMSM